AVLTMRAGGRHDDDRPTDRLPAQGRAGHLAPSAPAAVGFRSRTFSLVAAGLLRRGRALAGARDLDSRRVAGPGRPPGRAGEAEPAGVDAGVPAAQRRAGGADGSTERP